MGSQLALTLHGLTACQQGQRSSVQSKRAKGPLRQQVAGDGVTKSSGFFQVACVHLLSTSLLAPCGGPDSLVLLLDGLLESGDS